jgi:hypothetical protein
MTCGGNIGGIGWWFATAPETLCGSKLPRAAVCQRTALILLAQGTPPLGTTLIAISINNLGSTYAL